ncbi:hypothetical protein JJB99_32745 [Bradyrhizobium diazoefficiens]|uniref:hypothetical protein n=1 Tax=Bradyrhizobium diazoefficiens TaxID=1355477 RepID=UPI00190957AA|nr:hypothetical protein [Bradyrhizobium diazoefficiens]QQO14032.1 hypothetical protein JJB99_32745 [Bradyrhizobium diazoefficiens]
MLNSTSLLKVNDANHSVRLSYVFEDYGGARKGLTTAQLVSTKDPLSFSAGWPIRERRQVFVQGADVGILDAYRDLGTDDLENPDVLRGGALTCAFTVSDKVRVDASVGSPNVQIVEWDDCAGQTAYILGEGAVGTLLDELTHLRWGGRHIYPLIQLRRSDQDMRENRAIRNGAMVTTANSSLVGVIVAIYDEGTRYAVAPITDILDWHHFRLPQAPDELFSPPEEPATKPAAWRFKQKLDPKLANLITEEEAA